ncbi:hypothetical protein SAMN05444503_10262 [Pseudomonas sp. BS3767]|uniref:DUF1534 domain-containing protein n=1 Tax=Pseudomonas syringae TaxID=317 RepID=A0AB37ZDW6_PSESX|nr:hypothetical protein SAMN05444503_10262 [Pseudomonas sp. BS3767]SDL91968.1 hypothetical protein SAMN05444505_10163 [Pseudomonas syringae]SDM22801.1 hypothetical protein SAMN05444502_10162 [Pseudomonas sp. BS3759]
MEARRAKTRRFSGLAHESRPPAGRATNFQSNLKLVQHPFYCSVLPSRQQGDWVSPETVARIK